MQLQAEQNKQQEITLADCIRILWKRKKLIFGGTLLTTSIAIAVSFLLPNVYEVSTIFEPGKNGADSYVLGPETVKESIHGGAYDYRIRKELNIPFKDFPKIKALIPRGTSMVKVSIEATNPDLASSILNIMLKCISDDVNERLRYEKDNITNQIKTTTIHNKSVEEKIILAKYQLEETYKKIKTLENNKLKAIDANSEGAMPVLLYSSEIQTQQIYLNGLQEKLKNLEQENKGADIRIDMLKLELSKLKGVNVLKPATVSDEPIKPRKKLIAALVFALSFCAMTIMAFILESMKNKHKA